MKRISFNINESVYKKIKDQLNDSDESVSTATKAMLYAIAGEPLELTAKEEARLESIRERKEKLAELEKEMTRPRAIPKNPFAKQNNPTPGQVRKVDNGHPKRPIPKR